MHFCTKNDTFFKNKIKIVDARFGFLAALRPLIEIFGTVSHWGVQRCPVETPTSLQWEVSNLALLTPGFEPGPSVYACRRTKRGTQDFYGNNILMKGV